MAEAGGKRPVNGYGCDRGMSEWRITEMEKGKKTAFYGMFLALALVAGYVEQVMPVHLGVPGVKLGLANVVTMVLLYTMGVRAAAGITTIRILLAGMLFGTGFSIVYSAAGAFLSMAAMTLLKKTKKFSCTGVSVAGGVFHNIGQILVAMAVLETRALLYYLPVLILAGLAAGIVIGFLSGLLIHRLEPVIRREM